MTARNKLQALVVHRRRNASRRRAVHSNECTDTTSILGLLPLCSNLADPLPILPDRFERGEIAGIKDVSSAATDVASFQVCQASLALMATNCSTLGSR